MATNSLQAYLNGLAAASALGGTEKMLITQGGVIKQSTPAQMATYTGGGGGGGSLASRITAGQVNGSSTPYAPSTPISFPQYGGFVAVPGDTVKYAADNSPCVGMTSSSVIGGRWDNAHVQTFDIGAGSSSQIIGAKIINNADVAGTGINISTTNADDNIIMGNYIHCDGYGILTNTAAGPSGSFKRLAFVGNVIISDHADAIELNAPDVRQYGIAVVGNVFEATLSNGAENAGFAFGAAGINGNPIVGNCVTQSAYEAFHLEDVRDTSCIVGNSARNCKREGVLLYNMPSDAAEGDVVVGNTFKSFSTGLAKSGIRIVWDGNLTHGHLIVGNKMKDFDYGLEIADCDVICEANYVQNALGAVLQEGGARIYGKTLARNCTTLGISFNPGSFGEIYSDTTPTTLLDVTNQASGDLGNSMDGFGWPILAASLANGANNVNLFEAGTAFRGELRFTARVNASGANVIGAANVAWDGTTFTIGALPVKNNSGVLNVTAASMFNQNAGIIRLAITATGAQTADLYFKFFGFYHKRKP